MTYDPNQPSENTSPSTSVGSIRTNFSQFYTIFSNYVGNIYYNHISPNDDNQGNHGAVIFQKQTEDPDVEDNIAVLYAKDLTTAASTEPQIFCRNQETQALPDLPFPITYNKVSLSAVQYQTFMMGGYLVYIGVTNNIAVPITLTPIPTSILNVQISVQDVNGTNIPYDGGVVVTQPDTIKINSTNAPGGTNYLWLAIAKA